ncbi:hypothetical protein BT96DRAFT_984956 [Gymnopus androsaceus JB14]|uniref:Uncharacterized protein n=1 Tax=Gymnopus androsaceus JB14 TaxID=1447944 RepID=A0A6A4IF22_9AGAR|nr:hypothetical protein BT96DRAFT_984956 [Gymnopus androsaceus JB14]
MLERIDKEAMDIEQRLAEHKPYSMISASVYVSLDSLDSLLRHIQDATVIVLRYNDSDSHYIQEILNRLHSVQTILQQSGFLLILDFIGYTLNSSSLPYETFNTARRLYLQLNLDAHPSSFSLYSQNRLIRYLDDALDLDHSHSNGSRLPEGVVNILLGLLRGITDPECVSKAKAIVSTYTKVCTLSSNLDAAQEALATLEMALPDHIRPKEALDIFKEHVYSNTKLARAASVDTTVYMKGESHWVSPD